jgi:predicted XRE-type DNA-binding protein
MSAAQASVIDDLETSSGKRLREASKAARAKLRHALVETVSHAELSQTQAAKLCATDQPTISKVMGGRTESITIDQLTRWLSALGCRVEVHVHKPVDPQDGSLTVVCHE